MPAEYYEKSDRKNPDYLFSNTLKSTMAGINLRFLQAERSTAKLMSEGPAVPDRVLISPDFLRTFWSIKKCVNHSITILVFIMYSLIRPFYFSINRSFWAMILHYSLRPKSNPENGTGQKVSGFLNSS